MMPFSVTGDRVIQRAWQRNQPHCSFFLVSAHFFFINCKEQTMQGRPMPKKTRSVTYSINKLFQVESTSIGFFSFGLTFMPSLSPVTWASLAPPGMAPSGLTLGSTDQLSLWEPQCSPRGNSTHSPRVILSAWPFIRTLVREQATHFCDSAEHQRERKPVIFSAGSKRIVGGHH